LDYFKKAFNKVGWFIPPYVSIGYLSDVSKKIVDSPTTFAQGELEYFLSLIYSPDNLAAMVLHRYPEVPFVKDYKVIIGEAVQSHFSGLDHMAAVGLMPVIEGVGKSLASDRGIRTEQATQKIFLELATNCKTEVKDRNIGAVEEIESMMDSFAEFTTNYLYINSDLYSLSDKTNRHGMTHGAFADKDYGRPINFYKAIAAVDFLTFISCFRASVSCFAPNKTEESKKLAEFYKTCGQMQRLNPLSNTREKYVST
jgi:hypothetical protein